ncbi:MULTISPECIES: putative cytokinetic ring protein SteA [Cellulomonas]|uniref:Thiamin pyrophosphokinase catalytic domain-containing protein n=1 Tax=Cellulomonas gilvus (strain ATCC 13127 / NRRL B-14078) TaxID=593907 RepID=F8A7N6_CELGA|nr:MULTISPECIES: putative cytokinetic ring protein SteA [Cellulomonas]AEI12438.1 Thiamin pyrophosphokinase catalytic domain-containing protein [Cellulomonas gilvus ATCC 13127]MCR6689799.1 putative cytokinetic ring protein SteA [Cellulomonas sp.]
MRATLRRRRTPTPEPGVGGSARVDRRTKSLTKRLRPGDVAVIDHEDLDRVSAEALVACQPAAVLNAARSTSGRYPNLGPEILVAAGIPLIDDLGPDVMSITEGHPVRVLDGAVYDGDTLVAEGVELTEASVALAMEEARAGLSVQLESFAANTMDYLRRERDLLLDGVGVPDIDTVIDGRQVLIVVRGYHYKEDLVTLRPYIREYRPVLIGVDGGADAILDAGWRPDLIVGDMDSVSDRSLTCGAEIVVHAYRDGRAPGLARVEQLGVPHVVFPATGTSEDVAMLLADDKGAELIVAVGTHATLVEFLDKGRSGMASTFLTRLRVGGKLVDAKGVSRLYRQRISNVQLVLLVLAGLFALGVALASTAAGQTFFGLTGARIDDLTSWVSGLFGGGA